MIDLNTALSPKSGLHSRHVDGEMLVLDTENNQIHQLNDTAGLIWRMISDNSTISQIVNEVHSKYEVSQEQAHEDVIKIIDMLKSQNLLQGPE